MDDYVHGVLLVHAVRLHDVVAVNGLRCEGVDDRYYGAVVGDVRHEMEVDDIL